jgi:hypothetical protein
MVVLRRTRDEGDIGFLTKKVKLIVCLMQFRDWVTPSASGLRLIINPVFIEKLESIVPWFQNWVAVPTKARLGSIESFINFACLAMFEKL